MQLIDLTRPERIQEYEVIIFTMNAMIICGDTQGERMAQVLYFGSQSILVRCTPALRLSWTSLEIKIRHMSISMTGANKVRHMLERCHRSNSTTGSEYKQTWVSAEMHLTQHIFSLPLCLMFSETSSSHFHFLPLRARPSRAQASALLFSLSLLPLPCSASSKNRRLNSFSPLLRQLETYACCP